MKSKTSYIDAGSFLLGFTSIISQIIIIRELLVVFYGNELSIGLALAGWLLWISAGSLLAGKLSVKLKNPERALSNVLILTSVALPFHVLFIRNFGYLFNIPAGHMTGISEMLMGTFFAPSLVCLSMGFTFTLLARIASEMQSLSVKPIGRVYLFEGAGASVGGIMFSLVMIRFLSPMQSAFFIGTLNILMSLVLKGSVLRFILLTFFSISFLCNWPIRLEQASRQRQFAPFELIESVNSRYGNISLVKNRENISLYENGLLFFTSGDLLGAEEIVHYPMLQHRKPKRILLIGGGTAGALPEVLKYEIDRVDYVELDPELIKLSEKYLGTAEDSRVTVHNKDGRLFIKQSEGQKYDVIISNLPDPYTATLNRFYSLEFFREAIRILTPNGILALSLSSSENYINPEQAFYLGSIYKTLKTCFPDVRIFPGDTAYFMACNRKGMLTDKADVLIERLKNRNIGTDFVREYYLPFKLSEDRLRFIKNSLETKRSEINHDTKPIGYLYHMLLWISLFVSGESPVNYLDSVTLGRIVFLSTILFLSVFLLQRTGRARFKNMVRLSVATGGLTEISIQIITIMAFQFLHGYVYYKIGLILSSFMVGLVLGSACINSFIDRINKGSALYIKLQTLMCVYPLFLPIAFSINSGQLFFILLPIITGFMGGFQYPLANKLCLDRKEAAEKNAGYLYGLDLLGSSAGGVITGVALVPLLGITETCVLLTVINIFMLTLLICASDKRNL